MHIIILLYNTHYIYIYIYIYALYPHYPTTHIYIPSYLSIYLYPIYLYNIQIDTNKATLRDFVSNILKAKLSFNTPSINLNCSGIYEEGDGADESLESNLELCLAKCPGGGIIDGSIVEIEDFSQDLEVQ